FLLQSFSGGHDALRRLLSRQLRPTTVESAGRLGRPTIELSSIRRRSWPQAASIGRPLVFRTVTLTPPPRTRSTNPRTAAGDGRANGNPATGLYGMRFT